MRISFQSVKETNTFISQKMLKVGWHPFGDLIYIFNLNYKVGNKTIISCFNIIWMDYEFIIQYIENSVSRPFLPCPMSQWLSRKILRSASSLAGPQGPNQGKKRMQRSAEQRKCNNSIISRYFPIISYSWVYGCNVQYGEIFPIS